VTKTTFAAGSSAFDAVAQSYEAALDQGLRLSGERPDYFAERRIAWTARVLEGTIIRRVLDFGCGVGIAAPRLSEQFRPVTIWGFDPSTAAIARAKKDHPATDQTQFEFTADDATIPTGEIDLAYCTGGFHHIPLAERASALAVVRRSLRPGGWFALWENNPWNPGTRWVMSQIPFDRDAETLSPPSCRQMLWEAGFHVVRTDAWFMFPHMLRWLRPVEYLAHRLPLGAQYLVLARKPAASDLP
jgi:SAM-dependent methyltransferase